MLVKRGGLIERGVLYTTNLFIERSDSNEFSKQINKPFGL
jgi:hypothetical protein